MRLWHQALISDLPRQQLLGQHRECCALRGKGWGKPHSTVNYVFNYSPMRLYYYHKIVMQEMIKRGYKPDEKWQDPLYRGRNADKVESLPPERRPDPIYPEHNDLYLNECLNNLEGKSIHIKTIYPAIQ